LLNLGILALRQLAHDLNVPVLFISERNRDGMKSGGMNAGAGSRKIEYGAESLFDLDKEEESELNGAGERLITLKIPKNRHGEQGVKIPLYFNGALQQFRELTTEEAVSEAAKASAARKARGAKYRD
jgi:replicative DNA helicase